MISPASPSSLNRLCNRPNFPNATTELTAALENCMRTVIWPFRAKSSLLKIFFLLALFCVATALASSAQTLTTLYRFRGTDGDNTEGLTQAADGNFFGTTDTGGTGANCTYNPGCGTVFKITPAGNLTTLYNFCSQPNCADGFEPCRAPRPRIVVSAKKTGHRAIRTSLRASATSAQFTVMVRGAAVLFTKFASPP